MQVAKLIGGPGTGKTADLLRTMQRTVTHLGGDVMQVGFCSFTRAARREAARRASDQFNVPIYQLERDGWFCTLHSTCKRCLGVGEALLTDKLESRQWVENAVQEPVGPAGRETDGYYTETTEDRQPDATRALHFWDAARNRLEDLDSVWREADHADPRTPALAYCRQIVDRYEESKRLDHRLDFVDLLAQFSGWRFSAEYGATRCQPRGEPPVLTAWFFDEQQDVSALLHAVCERLASQSEWVYIAGDPFQSIYGWAGAHPKWLMGWPADKERVMPRSYRCPERILALAERVLSRCSDYWDRRISPAEHEGDCETAARLDELGLDPRDEWLLLARTNYLAGRIGEYLDREGIPWVSTRGGGRWHAPVRHAALQALQNLEAGAPIDGGEWCQVLKQLPSRADGTPLLTRGTKKRFAEMSDAQAQHPWVMSRELAELGATEVLIAGIKNGQWRQWIDGAADWTAAVDRWGQEAVTKPSIRVGTIHSVKGAEADNVMVCTTLSGPCIRGAETVEGRDEQQRVFYVGVSRARHRLVILDDPRVFPRARQELPSE